MKRLKYLFVFILPFGVYLALNRVGWPTFGPVIFAFVIIPVFEFFLKPDKNNLDEQTKEMERESKLYDWILYLAVPVQLLMLVSFLYVMELTEFGSISFFGKVFSMGLLCGVMGINIGHELGHRSSRMEQFLGEILLLTSLNTHFLPYHNEGHHREVATPEDAATAKKDQWVYSFWFTSHFRSYAKAWKIENNRMRKNERPILSLSNRMIVYSLANILVLGVIYYLFDLRVLIAFVMAAVIGIILLGTVDYIEHYGLLRKKNLSGRYERVQHKHSWNSDHQLGRLMLFNLSRHSDHHYKASKKYQLLDSLPDSPQMPTGYPGMMLLSLIPPLFFRIVNKKLRMVQKTT